MKKTEILLGSVESVNRNITSIENDFGEVIITQMSVVSESYTTTAYGREIPTQILVAVTYNVK